MSVPVLVAGLLVGCAVLLLLGARPGRPVHLGRPEHPSIAGRPGLVPQAPDQHVLRRHRLLVSVSGALVPPVLLGGALGAVAGLVVGAWVWRSVAMMEPPSRRRRRERAAQDLPYAVDMLAVVLASGASTSAALSAVVVAVGSPLEDELGLVRRGLALGRDPVAVWREAGDRPGLARLSRTMVRALDTGASVAEALHRLAEDLHATRRLDDEARARSVGVKVAAPLGLCLLPAFVLVGVVPLVGSTVTAFVVP